MTGFRLFFELGLICRKWYGYLLVLQEGIKLGFVLDEPGISTFELRLSLCKKAI